MWMTRANTIRTNLTKHNQFQDFPLRRYAVIPVTTNTVCAISPAFLIACKESMGAMRFWHAESSALPTFDALNWMVMAEDNVNPL
jgi:hypothetical protein